MTNMTKAQLVEKMEQMQTVEGVIDTILNLSAEDTRKLSLMTKTTSKGFKAQMAFLYGVK